MVDVKEFSLTFDLIKVAMTSDRQKLAVFVRELRHQSQPANIVEQSRGVSSFLGLTY